MFLFFFKQKTAYGMRISDWSSDVCSSDLPRYRRPGAGQERGRRRARRRYRGRRGVPGRGRDDGLSLDHAAFGDRHARRGRPVAGRPGGARRGPYPRDRKSLVEGKGVSVRVAIGGSRIIKKKNNTKHRRTERRKTTK